MKRKILSLVLALMLFSTPGAGQLLAAEPQETVTATVTQSIYGQPDAEAEIQQEAEVMSLPAAAAPEQFSLAIGETYYFDLSEQGAPGVINADIPDQTLHYVPFTYAGTVNAYRLKSRSADPDTALTDSETAAATDNPSNPIGYINDHSLFIADYNVSREVSWDNLNAASLIFGKDYISSGITYRLRAPSAGSEIDPYNAAVQDITPYTNEWDTILTKDCNLIQNWSGTGSLGQDTFGFGDSYRAVRGMSTVNYWYTRTSSYTGEGFRPILEILDPGLLNSDSLQEVTLELNGGSLGDSIDTVKIVVSNGTSYTAPGNSGLNRPEGNLSSYFKWNTQADGKGDDYEAGASVPMHITKLYAKWAPPEEFSLSTGTTYYFDLSGETIPGTVNAGFEGNGLLGPFPGLPDTTLHYVPFTYAGTVHAYSLKSRSSDNAAAKTDSQTAAGTDNPSNAIGCTSDHSMFIADHNVSHAVSWDDLDAESLVFGKDYTSSGISYRLRVPSSGSSPSHPNTPLLNEWDSILDKNEENIKNWSNIASWGQDTVNFDNGTIRKARGLSSIRAGINYDSFNNYHFFGFRPILEISDAASLDANSLQEVTLYLNGGSLGDSTGAISIAVKEAADYKAPSDIGVTRPSGNTYDYFQWNTKEDGSGTSYLAGETVPGTVAVLYAQWELPAEPTPSAAIDYVKESLVNLTANAAYKITVNGVSEDETASADGSLPIQNTWFGKTISIIKKGNSATTLDSAAQSLIIPARPEAPAVSGVNESYPDANDGRITGVTAAMEYRKPGDAGWTAVAGSEITGLPAGAYHVRLKATGGSFSSYIQTINIGSAAKVLSGITITAPPLKTLYTEGESFDKTGMIVTAAYNDHSSAVVTGYTIIPSGALSAADTKVTISYNEGGVTKAADQPITVNAVIYHTVTFNPNGGTAVGTQLVKDGEKAVKPANPSKTGYRFIGWYSNSALTSVFNFNTFITNDIILFAKWSTNGGNSGGSEDSGRSSSTGNGSSTSAGPSAPPQTYTAGVANTDTAANSTQKATLSVTVNQSTGSAIIDIGPQQSNIITAGKSAVISVPAIPGVDAYTLGIPSSYLSAPDPSGTLTIDSAVGIITLTMDMLAGITATEGSKAEITISRSDSFLLPENVRAAVGSRPVIQLAVAINGKQTEWNKPDSPVTVSIPYKPTESELANPENIIIWYIDGSGIATAVPNGHYDPAAGTVTFSVTHFSSYAVGYNRISYTDVSASAWYSKAVGFIAARDITAGTYNGNYKPEAKLTRAEFLVMVMKAYEIEPEPNREDNFKDAGSTYYTGYLAAAKRLGISNGVGNNMFAPEKEISRQELFTLLYNSLNIIGRLPGDTLGKPLSVFSDADRISPWAKAPIAILAETGTIGGSNGMLFPTRTATRSEMAQILYNLLSR